jgi:hypothetical protein
MQGRTVVLCASLLTIALLSGEVVAQTTPAPPPAAAAKPVVVADKPVDENGVPAWAKRRRLHPVQSCETKPNIGVETWRQKYDSSAPQRLKIRVPTSTCH